LTAEAQAAKRAQTEARKEEAQRKNNAEKSTQLPKQAKSKASQKPQSKVTKNRGGGAVRRRRVAHTIGCQKSVRPMRTSHHINTLISALKKDKCTPRVRVKRQ
jgi:hypothetical protein